MSESSSNSKFESLFYQAYHDALNFYSKDQRLKLLEKAKAQFFELCGKAEEEDENFELKMNGFNDWFLFQSQASGEPSPFEVFVLQDERYNKNQDLKQIKNVLFHSLFEYRGKSFTGLHVFYDFFYKKKYKFKELNHLLFLDKELLTARIVVSEKGVFFLQGFCLLPYSLKSLLLKQVKRMLKVNAVKENQKYLLNLEKLKTKMKHFQHVEPKEIFKKALDF